MCLGPATAGVLPAVAPTAGGPGAAPTGAGGALAALAGGAGLDADSPVNNLVTTQTAPAGRTAAQVTAAAAAGNGGLTFSPVPARHVGCSPSPGRALAMPSPLGGERDDLSSVSPGSCQYAQEGLEEAMAQQHAALPAADGIIAPSVAMNPLFNVDRWATQPCTGSTGASAGRISICNGRRGRCL